MDALKGQVTDLLKQYIRESSSKADQERAGELLALVLSDEVQEAHLRTAVELRSPAALVGFLSKAYATALQQVKLYSEEFGHPTEGINGRRTMYMTQREPLCAAIFRLVDDFGYVLIKAPPQSGKTSALQLFAQYVKKKGGSSVYINASISAKDFDKEFAVKCGGSLQDLIQSGRELTVLVDEVQAIYKEEKTKSRGFWTDLKVFSAGTAATDRPEHKHQVRIVLAAAYGGKRSAARDASSKIQAGGAASATPAAPQAPCEAQPAPLPPAASAAPAPLAACTSGSTAGTAGSPAWQHPQHQQAAPQEAQQAHVPNSPPLSAQPLHQAAQQPMATLSDLHMATHQPQDVRLLQQQPSQASQPSRAPQTQPSSASSSPAKTPISPDYAMAVITVLPHSHPRGASLQLAPEEFEELWASFVTFTRMQLGDVVKNHVWGISGGQVGLAIVCLDYLHQELCNELRQPDKINCNAVFKLCTERFINSLQNVRSLQHSQQLLADVDMAHVVRMLLWASPLPMEVLQGSLSHAVRTLNTNGHVVIDASEVWVAIASPLHWIYSFRELYRSRINPHTEAPADILDLLTMVLERINPCVLQQTMTLGVDGRVLEACWQFEVYRAATSLLHDTIVSPDVGTVWGAKGYVDFYLPPPLSTALELTRDSSLLREHLQRFSPGDASTPKGKYHPMLACGAVKQWAVVDFLSPGRQPASVQHDCLYSVRPQDATWRSADILHNGQVVRHVHLAGNSEAAGDLSALWEALQPAALLQQRAVAQRHDDQRPWPME